MTSQYLGRKQINETVRLRGYRYERQWTSGAHQPVHWTWDAGPSGGWAEGHPGAHDLAFAQDRMTLLRVLADTLGQAPGEELWGVIGVHPVPATTENPVIANGRSVFLGEFVEIEPGVYQTTPDSGWGMTEGAAVSQHPVTVTPQPLRLAPLPLRPWVPARAVPGRKEPGRFVEQDWRGYRLADPPASGGTVTTEYTAQGRRAVSAPPPLRTPPPKGTRERKLRVTNPTFARFLRGVWAYTETVDVIEAVHGALPRGYRRHSDPLGMLQDIFSGIQKMDPGKLAENLITNEIEDRVIGRLSGGAGRALRGNPWGPDIGGALPRLEDASSLLPMEMPQGKSGAAVARGYDAYDGVTF